MREVSERARSYLDSPNPGEALFEVLQKVAGVQDGENYLDSRALFDAIGDRFLADAGISAAHAEVVDALDQLLSRAKAAGAVRSDVGAIDVLMLLKGVCEATTAFAHVQPEIVARQLDLVRAAVSVNAAQQPLSGRSPTLADVARATAAAASERKSGTRAAAAVAEPATDADAGAVGSTSASSR
jgi:hypothetical protein